MRRVTTVLIAAVLAGASLAALGPARAASYELQQTYITSGDGTRLHAWVYRPTGITGPTPVVLTATPYAGSGGHVLAPNPQGNQSPSPFGVHGRALDRGYSVVVVSLRGYGSSEGCYDFGGPGEQADVAAAIRWAAAQPWSTGKVAMVGGSYEGLTGLMGLASKEPALRAVVATSAHPGYKNLYSHGVRNTGGGHGLAGLYAVYDLYPPGLNSPSDQHQAWAQANATNAPCWASVTADAVSNDPTNPYWVDRDMPAKIRGTKIPTILVQGVNDWNVRPSAIADLWDGLSGPKRLLLGPWDHGVPGLFGSTWINEVLDWFDEHVKGLEPELGNDRPRVRIQTVDGAWRSEPAWPPKPGASSWSMALLPGTYVDVAGNNGETGVPDAYPVKPSQPLPTGRGTWTFSPPLAGPLHLSGEPVLALDTDGVVPGVKAIALVYDVAPDGTARFVTRGAAPVTAATTGFTLYPMDWRFPAGHRVGVLVTGADDLWFEPSGAGTPVTITGGSVSVARVGSTGTPMSGPFGAKRQHPPFTVDPATFDARTSRG